MQDQLLNSQVTTAQHAERERAYDMIASILKIPFLDEEVANTYSRKMSRVDGSNLANNKKDPAFSWTNVVEKNTDALPSSEGPMNNTTDEGPSDQQKASEYKEMNKSRYRECIFGEEALKISPTEPYCLRRPIRRGHLNVSLHYPTQQVLEDLCTIWDWILHEKLHIPSTARGLYSAILVVPETFDSREIKELLSIVLQDLRFSSAVVHQEALAAVFGNGWSTACVVNIGAQAASIMCVEDGVTLPTTGITLSYGGEDISRCLLWTQRHHQTWPPVRTDALVKPIDLLMLNGLKETCCQVKEGETDAVVVVHSYEDGMSPGTHKTRLTALNVPPMGLFYPKLLVPEVYPPPPCTWFQDFEDMLDDSWPIEYMRRPDSDTFFPAMSGGYPMWESFPLFTAKPKKEENLGLAEAITKSIRLTGRLDLQRKLFCSIQLVGGVALTPGLMAAVEDRVSHAIPSMEAIDMVEVLQPRTNPAFATWKGGAILGILDFGQEAWIHREDWIQGGLYVGGNRKYRDSFFIQAQPMCYINT